MSTHTPAGRFAAFDIGSNTVQVVVAEREAAGFRVLLDEEAITRLGEGVDRTGRLGDAALVRTVAQLGRFAGEARRLGATRFAACATSAARDAANGQALVDAAREAAGVEVEIISGAEEAALTFRAVQAGYGGGGGPLLALDVGGGSTEVVWGPEVGAWTFRRSVDVGSVRLTERFVSAHPIPEAEVEAMRDEVRRALAGLPRPPRGSRAVAVAATATTLAAVMGNGAAPEGAEVSARDLAPLLVRLCGMDLEARREVPGMDPRRADVVCAGGFILLEALRHLGLDSCRASGRGVRYGLLHARFGAGREAG